MKKTLLIGAAFLAGIAGYAQNNRQAANLNNKNVKIDNESPASGTKGTGNATYLSPNAVCIPKKFNSGPNSFGVGGGTGTYVQGCLSYNKDLNSYLWTHRASADWAFAGKTTGAIQSTWYNVTTGIWDSTILYRDSTNSFRGRYPTGSFYNPAGNTNIANAYVVGSGPCIIAGAFAGPWYSTRKLTGTSTDQSVLPPNNKNYNTAPAGPLGNTLFPYYDMQQVGTKVIVGGDLNDTNTSANANHNKIKGSIIGKVTFSGTLTPVWSRDSIVPGFYFKRNAGGNGYAGDGNGARIAFAPNGMTGYAVLQGRLATNYGNSADSMMAPIVYKTTNGGTTWAPVLLGYDWRKGHPELIKNVGLLPSPRYRPLLYKATHFQLNYKHGIDVAVDANNVLHLVGTMQDPYMNGKFVDSLGFTDTYSHDYKKYHPVMWDLMTDGTCWKTMMIDSVISSYVGDDPALDTTASRGGICNPPTYLGYGARLQVSRSTDGTKIIYAWGDSDPLSTGTVYNSAPDIWMKAYDVTSGKVSPSSNVTSGISTCFFHYLADVAYFDAVQNKWIAPVVYTLPRTTCTPGVYDGTAPANHVWVNCGAYGAANFTINANLNPDKLSTFCTISIKTNDNAFVNSVSNYPNPFNNTTNIVVNLNEGKAINVQVFDGIGNVVAIKNVNGNIGENTIVFDATNLNAGVYYYTVTAGYEKVTKKMVIQK